MDTLKPIRNLETKNPCSVSVVYKWHERFRNGRKSTEDDLRDGRPCVVKMTIKDKMMDISFTPASESLAKFDVLKQQSSNFTQMKWGVASAYRVFETVLQCRKQRWSS